MDLLAAINPFRGCRRASFRHAGRLELRGWRLLDDTASRAGVRGCKRRPRWDRSPFHGHRTGGLDPAHDPTPSEPKRELLAPV